MSIRLKLTLWYTGILAVIVLLFGMVMYVFLENNLYDNVQNDLREKGKEVVETSKRSGVFRQYISFPFDRFHSYFFQIRSIDGELLQRSENLGDLELPQSISEYEDGKWRASLAKYDFNDQVTLMIYDMPIINGQNQVIGILQVAKVVNEVEDALAAFRTIYIFTGCCLLILASTIGWFMARKALNPIEDVVRAAEQIEKADDLSHRIMYKGPKDEIGRLVEKINGMLERIEKAYNNLDQAYRTQRRFVSDASHELRTPLTTIRGNMELLQKMHHSLKGAVLNEDELVERTKLTEEAMQDIVSEAERMSRLVNDMLSLARADAGQEMEKGLVEMRPLVEEVGRRAEFLPRKADWIIGELTDLDHQMVWGNKDYLQQLLFIFIDNAFKYTPEGSVIMDGVAADGQVGIRIRDTGVGMDRDEVPHIFDRFYRADESRGETSGTGLGLSIAKWIIDEHNGSVEVETAKGVGTSFIIWLPIAGMKNE